MFFVIFPDKKYTFLSKFFTKNHVFCQKILQKTQNEKFEKLEFWFKHHPLKTQHSQKLDIFASFLPNFLKNTEGVSQPPLDAQLNYDAYHFNRLFGCQRLGA